MQTGHHPYRSTGSIWIKRTLIQPVLKREWREDRGRQEGSHFWGAGVILSYAKKKNKCTRWWCHDDITHRDSGGGDRGTGDTYFQQLAVLQTAQQKNDKTKERLRLEFYKQLKRLHLTIREKEGNKNGSQQREEAWGQVGGNKRRHRKSKVSKSSCICK